MRGVALLVFLCSPAACEANPTAAADLLKSVDELQSEHAAQLQRLQAARKLAGVDRPLAVAAPETVPPRKLADDVKLQFDTLWALICGSLVMLMQSGFAFLESGSVRAKNAGIVLLKNVMDVCTGTLVWYTVGYAFAYGEGNAFIGTTGFVGIGFMEVNSSDEYTGTTHFYNWFFQWAFCATSATIVSGGVAERIAFPAYIFYTLVMSGLIYPIIVHWTWCSQGWLYSNGFVDFAGSGIVHLTGGVGALVGAAILGPRQGRWENHPDEFVPCDINLVVLGTLILWFGWYGFNCGSTLTFSTENDAHKASIVAMNTTLSAATGGLTVLIMRARTKKFDLGGMCNGILAGLVCCCAGADVYRSGYAVLVGFCGAVAYEVVHVVIQALHIDDPLDAFPVHGGGGLVGLLLKPLLDINGVDAKGLGWNALGAVVIIVWSGGLSVLVFGALRMLNQLKVDEDEESYGGDFKMTHAVSAQSYEVSARNNNGSSY